MKACNNVWLICWNDLNMIIMQYIQHGGGNVPENPEQEATGLVGSISGEFLRWSKNGSNGRNKDSKNDRYLANPVVKRVILIWRECIISPFPCRPFEQNTAP